MNTPLQFITEMPPQVLLFFFISTSVSVLLIFAEAIVSYNIGAYGRLALNFPPFDKLSFIVLRSKPPKTERTLIKRHFQVIRIQSTFQITTKFIRSLSTYCLRFSHRTFFRRF